MEKSKIVDRLQEAGILILTAVVSGIAASLYKDTQYEIVKVIVLSVVSAGCVIFAIEESRIESSFLFDNVSHLWRFSLLYFIFLIGSMIFPWFLRARSTRSLFPTLHSTRAGLSGFAELTVR